MTKLNESNRVLGMKLQKDLPSLMRWRTRKSQYALHSYHMYKDTILNKKIWVIETIKLMRWF